MADENIVKSDLLFEWIQFPFQTQKKEEGSQHIEWIQFPCYFGMGSFNAFLCDISDY